MGAPVAEGSARTMEAVMRAAAKEEQETMVPAGSRTSTEAPPVEIVAVTKITKETGVDQVVTKDAEMTATKESSRDVLSTGCPD